jgi:hypothetical protein
VRGTVEPAGQAQEQRSITSSVGILNEKHLHASLKARYLEPGDETEARVDGYIVDILRPGRPGRPGLIIEVQTGSFSKIARKMRDLVTRHRVLLVHPIPRDRWIVKLARTKRDVVTRRKSPKHAGLIDVFEELVAFPDLIGHPNFGVDVVLTAEETVWRPDSRKGWRRRGWVVAERRLLDVYETVSLRGREDFGSTVPAGLPAEFLTSDLAAAVGRPRFVAQRMAYCLRRAGVIEKVGGGRSGFVYAVVG